MFFQIVRTWRFTPSYGHDKIGNMMINHKSAMRGSCWTTCWLLKCQYETLPTKRSWGLWLKVAGKSMEGWSKCRAASAGSSNPRVVKSRVGCVGPPTANFGRWSGPGVQLTSREISQTWKAKPDVLQKLKQQGWHLTAAPFHPDTWFWVYHGKDSGGKLKIRHVV